ncbi:MAG: HEAT repeat domain-containing protein [Oscillatoriales cyanobacterium SM2_2_1]|nr:HEAT repeat domain-containing protein [Oscillatoriales cyanobacterium SM2_2_1]
MNDSLSPLKLAIAQASTPTDLIAAVEKLSQIGESAAIPDLIAVFGYNNPAAATIAMKGLIALGQAAVPQLIHLMDDYNYGARAYTIRALSAIGDPRALDLLIMAAQNDFAPSVRRAAIKGLGTLQWRWSDDPEGDRQRVLTVLEQLLDDTDWSMRYAVIVALDRLQGELDAPTLGALLHLAKHKEGDRTVQARIWTALQRHAPILVPA